MSAASFGIPRPLLGRRAYAGLGMVGSRHPTLQKGACGKAVISAAKTVGSANGHGWR
ncbi:hypothetical protein [Actinoallomurus sp. CA-150999]|uniref:hypothetical protein n=1 Tax=Actinoallomurus sp. CA-150999 TaxID=3239887 RepID=UPI003D8DB061